MGHPSFLVPSNARRTTTLRPRHIATHALVVRAAHDALLRLRRRLLAFVAPRSGPRNSVAHHRPSARSSGFPAIQPAMPGVAERCTTPAAPICRRQPRPMGAIISAAAREPTTLRCCLHPDVGRRSHSLAAAETMALRLQSYWLPLPLYLCAVPARALCAAHA